MCLKKHKTCCSSSDRHFWSFWRITSISICITIITISTSFISFTKCFTSFSRFQPFHWFYRFPNFHTILYLPFFHIWQTVNQPLLLLSSAAATRWLDTHAINSISHLSGNTEHFLFRGAFIITNLHLDWFGRSIKWVKCVKTFLKDCHVRHKNHTESPKKDVKIASCSLLDLSHWLRNAIIGAVKRMGWWVVPKRKRIKS